MTRSKDTNQSNGKQSVTIKTIASEMGVSFSTVSKALNDNPAIKESTRQAIQQKASELGYTPNSLAKSLRNSESHTIAVILNDIENPVLTHIFKSISDEMAKYEYTTLILDSYFDIKQEKKNLEVALAQKPAFIIWEPSSIKLENYKMLSSLQDRVVLFGPRFNDYKSHQVSVDYAAGGYDAAMNMLNNGHRDTLVITVPLSVPNSNDFIKGIKRAYAEYKYKISDDRILISTSSTINGGFIQINKLWDFDENRFRIPFTGVMTFDDNMAYGVYKAAKHFNLKVPNDISISGFDDNPLTAFTNPPFDTVHLPREEIAKNCIEIIKSVLINKDNQIHGYYTHPYLVKRGSVCNLFKK